jgi:hypothetical protein
VTKALPLLLSLLLSAFLTGCSGDQASGSQATDTAEAAAKQAAAREIDAELSLASSEIADWLRQQPWVHDGDDASLRAVTAIVSAQYHSTSARSAERQADVLTLLEALDSADWYTGNLWRSEKLFVAAIFDLYAKAARDLPPPSSTNSPPESEAMPDYSWVELLAKSLREKLHWPYVTLGGQDLQLISTYTGDSISNTQITSLASVYLSRIEAFTGAYNRPYILFIEDESLTSSRGEVCATANSSLRIVTYGPSCVRGEIIAHELTHLATPDYFSVWFEEGTAFLLGAYLTDVPPEQIEAARARYPTAFHVGGLLDTNVTDDTYFNEGIAGFYFLYDYARLAGYESVSHVLKTLTVPLVPDYAILSALVEATPNDKRVAVRDLIDERCRAVFQGRDVPC